MPEHLLSIFGMEKDRVNCPFYFKIGACHDGDQCSRLHNKPSDLPDLRRSKGTTQGMAGDDDEVVHEASIKKTNCCMEN
ncbi:hypothetical protein BS78_K129200 [Paspalum vaginatum]|uniref:C3H1-type domain-containing protein n=1 Tax=Paspalum vaginatum TaxID=158149 RepID=A0A9W7XBM6_9POAL|nr:hypothetical protein BS78_K129200 [Paspalum vaginatum]